MAETLWAGRSCTIGPSQWLAQVLLLGTENRPHRVAACHRASGQGAERAFHRLCVGWLGRDHGASLVFLLSPGAAHPIENAMEESIVHRVHITRHVTACGSVHYTYGQHDSTEAAEPGVLHLFFCCTAWNSCSLDPVGRPINLLRTLGGNKFMAACPGIADRRTKMPSSRACIPDDVDGLGVVWLAAANGGAWGMYVLFLLDQGPT